MRIKFDKNGLMKYEITRGAFQLLLDLEKAYDKRDSKVLLKKAYKLLKELKRGHEINNQYYDTLNSEEPKSLKDYLINTIITVNSAAGNSD